MTLLCLNPTLHVMHSIGEFERCEGVDGSTFESMLLNVRRDGLE